MDYLSFVRSEGSKKNSIFLLEGGDDFLLRSCLNNIKNGFLEDEVGLVRFDSTDMEKNLESFFSEVFSYSLMSQNKLIVVSEFYPNADTVKKQFSDFGDLEDTKIVFINSKKKSNLSKIKDICVVDCSSIPDSNYIDFLIKKAKRSNVTLTPQNATILKNYNLSNLNMTISELEKLIAYVGEGGEITLDVINEVSIKTTDYHVFLLTDALGKKDNNLVLTIINDMNSKGLDYIQIMTAVYNHFRRMLYVSLSKGSDAEIANELDVKEYAIKVSRLQSKNFTQKNLRKICSKYEKLDGEFKSGGITIENAFWDFLFSILLG